MPAERWSEQRQRPSAPGMARRGPGRGPDKEERTYRQLYDEAKERGIEGRSKMSKAELERALAR